MTNQEPSEEEIKDALRVADGKAWSAHSADALEILAAALRAAQAENTELHHKNHRHCITPCDQIRIQEENHNSYLLLREMAEMVIGVVEQHDKDPRHRCDGCSRAILKYRSAIKQ